MSRAGVNVTHQSEASDFFNDLHTFYRTGDELVSTDLPKGTRQVVAVRATGEQVTSLSGTEARFTRLPPGTWAIQARGAGGGLLSEEFTTVAMHAGERPVHGFATSFTDDATADILNWHRSLRSTVVQVYDWMASYTEPLGAAAGWIDPSNRPVSLTALQALSSGLRSMGAIAHAYAPIYAVGNEFARRHPEMLLFDGDGNAVRFLDQIVLANPGNVNWQRHFVESYGAASDVIGFNGFHVDTYGYPRIAHDVNGAPVDMREAYGEFLDYLRAERPNDVISFNQVNGVPSAARPPGQPTFRYCEVWPPNDQWRHFEGLLDRSSGRGGRLGSSRSREPTVRGSLACYPPVWGVDGRGGDLDDATRDEALRTDLCTEAIATLLGTSSLLFGDRRAVLCDPYYPKHAPLRPSEATTVIRWRRFALRCRDLFSDGEDTSWYEIGDENGAVSVEADASVRPEPLGGGVMARVSIAESIISVGVLDLTGSTHGSWSERTGKGRVRTVKIRVLLDSPRRWMVDAAVLGAGDDQFAAVGARVVAHRQGWAVEVDLPFVEGWSVLRIRRLGVSDAQ